MGVVRVIIIVTILYSAGAIVCAYDIEVGVTLMFTALSFLFGWLLGGRYEENYLE